MKVKQINQYFKHIGEFQVRHRLLMIILSLILTAIGVAGLEHITMANSRENWFDDHEAIEIATDRFEQEFGNNDNIGILFEAEDVFHPEVLKVISQIGKELIEKVPYADEVTSLTDMEIVVGTEDGMRVFNPFKDGIPSDPNELQEIKKLILSRTSLRNRLVTDDAKETWLTLSLVEYPPEEEWKKTTDVDPMFQSGEMAIEIVTDPKWKSALFTMKAAGMPYSETEERDYFGKETKIRVFSGFIAMVILLILFLRSIRGVFVPVFTTIMGTVVVFGISGWLSIGIDANMVTLPVLLGMALSVGYSIHIVNAFKRFFRISGKRKQAVIEAVEETGWPIFFTAITTMGSVLSFVSAGIITIQWLGYTCAAIVFTDYLFVSILVPILMSFGKDKTISEEQVTVSKLSLFDNVLKNIGASVLAHKKAILIVFIIVTAVVLPGVRQVTVNMDMFAFLGRKIPYVNRLWEVVNSQLGSYLSYNITIDYKKDNAIKNPEVLKAFDKLNNTVAGFKLTKKSKDSAAVYSILDIIKEMNQTLHADNQAYYRVPDDREYIAQLLLLYEMSGGTKAFRWVDEGYSILRTQVSITEFDANEVVRELDTIYAMGEKLFPGATVTVVGSAIQFAELNGKIVKGEINSILLALIIIGILLVIVFASIKTGLIGMIPNLAPLIAIGGYMGYFNSPLDMMTMTIMPMLIGIAVDDTIHFINQIKYQFEITGNYKEAVMASFTTVGKTLAMTTIVLSITFMMYLPSPVMNLARVGGLAALGLTVALLCDYFVTPVLIILTKPFGPERQTEQE